MVRPQAVRRVPRAGYDVTGRPVDKSGYRVIDVNKAVGATTDVDWKEPETGYDVIIEHETDIKDGTKGSGTGNSLQKSPGVLKQTYIPSKTAANEDIPDGGRKTDASVQKKTEGDLDGAGSSSG